MQAGERGEPLLRAAGHGDDFLVIAEEHVPVDEAFPGTGLVPLLPAVDHVGGLGFTCPALRLGPAAGELKSRICRRRSAAIGLLAKCRGKQRALVAVGNSILVIAWHLLSNPDAHFADLGPDWHDRIAAIRRKRQLIAELERLSGKKVLLQEETAA